MLRALCHTIINSFLLPQTAVTMATTSYRNYSAAAMPPPSTKAQDYVKEFILKSLCNMRKVHQQYLTESSTFSKLGTTIRARIGLDPIDQAEIVCLLEDSFGVDLTEWEQRKINSVPTAVEVFSAKYMENIRKLSVKT